MHLPFLSSFSKSKIIQTNCRGKKIKNTYTKLLMDLGWVLVCTVFCLCALLCFCTKAKINVSVFNHQRKCPTWFYFLMCDIYIYTKYIYIPNIYIYTKYIYAHFLMCDIDIYQIKSSIVRLN